MGEARKDALRLYMGIAGESCLGGQVIAFGLGIGICFCIKSVYLHVIQ